MAVVTNQPQQRRLTRLTGKHPVLESLIRSSGIVCESCDGTGDALPPGALIEKCEECNGTGMTPMKGTK